MYPSNLSFRLLVWRDTCGIFMYVVTLPISLLAMGIMIFSDSLENKLNGYYTSSNKRKEISEDEYD